MKPCVGPRCTGEGLHQFPIVFDFTDKNNQVDMSGWDQEVDLSTWDDGLAQLVRSNKFQKLVVYWLLRKKILFVSLMLGSSINKSDMPIDETKFSKRMNKIDRM